MWAEAMTRLTVSSTSPCIGVCQLDPARQICRGCGRTIAEIAAWPNLPEDERRAILARLEATVPSAPRER
jgi:predicted Fe-S protein YdhL (DUF1289 family)